MQTSLSSYGRPAHNWFVNFNLDFMVEIPTEAARRVLSPSAVPVEPHPGVSLLGLGLLAFDPGNLGYLPAFEEISLSVVVKPDLSGGRLPRFAFEAIRVAGTSDAFLRWARHRDKMPVYRAEGLQVALDRDALGGRCWDARGPIFHMANSHPEPRFEEDVVDVQIHSRADGARWLNHMAWAGPMFQHQQRGAQVHLYEHPFFGELGLGEGPRPCFLQMMTPARTAAVMAFEEPVRVG